MTTVAGAGARRSPWRRPLTWFLLVWNAIGVAAVLFGVAAYPGVDCAARHLDPAACTQATHAYVVLGFGITGIVWIVVDLVLGVPWALRFDWRKLTWAIIAVNLVAALIVVTGVIGANVACPPAAPICANSVSTTTTTFPTLPPLPGVSAPTTAATTNAYPPAMSVTGGAIAVLVVLWLFVDLILGVIWLATGRHRHCPVCGHQTRVRAAFCPRCGQEFRP